MPRRAIIDQTGKVTEEDFEYTQAELDEQAANRASAAERRAAQVAQRAEWQGRLRNMEPNENSMVVLKLRVNYLLQAMRELKGL